MSYYTKLSSELSDSAGARDTVSISHILSAIRGGAFPTWVSFQRDDSPTTAPYHVDDLHLVYDEHVMREPGDEVVHRDGMEFNVTAFGRWLKHKMSQGDYIVIMLHDTHADDETQELRGFLVP